MTRRMYIKQPPAERFIYSFQRVKILHRNTSCYNVLIIYCDIRFVGVFCHVLQQSIFIEHNSDT